jgi:hypothetical protein
MVEQIPNGSNRERFPNQRGCDSCDVLVKEASRAAQVRLGQELMSERQTPD